MSPTERFREVLADLERREGTCAARNKPTLWAYYNTSRIALALLFEDCYSDAAVLDRCALVLDDIAADCRDLEPLAAAHRWALGVYCRRIGRLKKRPSRAWLRERAGVKRPGAGATGTEA